MIFQFIFAFIIDLVNALSSFLPQVTTLPLGMDTALSTAVSSYRMIMQWIPPLQTMFQVLLWYLGYKLALLVAVQFRVIKLGNRAL